MIKRLFAVTQVAMCSVLAVSAAADPGQVQAPDPHAARVAKTPALGPGSVAEFDVQRLVSLNRTPGPSEKWQHIRERRTILSQAGGMIVVRIEENFGPGTQPSERTETIAAAPGLPAQPGPSESANADGARRATGPDGVPRRAWVGRETITTPAGTFECTRIAVEIVQMSSGTHIDEWYAAGLPWPVRSSSVTGAGATHFVKTELVKLETEMAPGGNTRSA